MGVVILWPYETALQQWNDELRFFYHWSLLLDYNFNMFITGVLFDQTTMAQEQNKYMMFWKSTEKAFKTASNISGCWFFFLKKDVSF